MHAREKRGHRRVPKSGLVSSLSPTAEFLIVVIGAFALPVWSSLYYSLYGDPQLALQITSVELQWLVVQEMVTLGLLVWFLRARGWSIESLAPYPTWCELAEGAGLALASYLAWVLLWLVLPPLDYPAPAGGLDWASVLALCIINPLFEEVFLCAYMLPILVRWRGAGVAVALSLAVRLSFHTYQGPLGLVSVGMFGLIVSAYFVGTRRLWPVLIAHGLLDFVGLVGN